MTQDEAKLLAAKRAVEFVGDGMAVGLGTGTTATLFIRELGKRVRNGLRIRAIASSDASRDLAEQFGIRMTNFAETPMLDLNVDGADEVCARPGVGLELIKGGGGAHLREKIVASASRQFVVVADETKVVRTLGRFPLPVEVIPLALPLVSRRLEELGLHPVLRQARKGDGPWITDEGNVILDCHCGVIEAPETTAAEIRSIVGVVEHGLFLGMATLALVAGKDGVRELRP